MSACLYPTEVNFRDLNAIRRYSLPIGTVVSNFEPNAKGLSERDEFAKGAIKKGFRVWILPSGTGENTDGSFNGRNPVAIFTKSR